MGLEFFQTVMGKMFFEGTLPSLVRQLERLNKNLERIAPEKRCPQDGSALVFIGDAGIVDGDGRWDSQTSRYRCEKGHMVFIGDAARIDEGESS